MNFKILILVLFIGSSGLTQDLLPTVKFENLPQEKLNEPPYSTIQDLKGKVVLVDFWASWCEPCKEALPHYNKLYLKYKDQGLVVIGINEDEDIKERDLFLKNNPLAIPLYYDKEKTFIKNFQVKALPTLYVFDRNLKLISSYRGYKASNAQKLDTQILNLLKKAP